VEDVSRDALLAFRKTTGIGGVGEDVAVGIFTSTLTVMGAIQVPSPKWGGVTDQMQ
jgi:hypothetical protein